MILYSYFDKFSDKSIQGIIAQQVLGNKDFKRFMEVIAMEDYGAVKKLLAHKHYVDVEVAREEGCEEGIDLALSRLIQAKNYLNQGFSIKEISNMVSLDEAALLKIL